MLIFPFNSDFAQLIGNFNLKSKKQFDKEREKKRALKNIGHRQRFKTPNNKRTSFSVQSFIIISQLL